MTPNMQIPTDIPPFVMETQRMQKDAEENCQIQKLSTLASGENLR